MLAARRISKNGGNLNFLARCIASKYSKINLEGIFPAVVTPFSNNEDIDYDKLEKNVTKWSAVPFRGYLVHGSNGEFVNMDINERTEIVQKMKSFIPQTSNKILLVGSGCQSTRETILLTSEMAKAGGDAALVVTPHFYKGRLTNEALTTHYTKVADESPIPIILYSVPANTGIDLDADVVIKLANHPNIIGLKDSGGDIAKLGYIINNTHRFHFQVLAGSAGFLLPALSVGCVGGIFALGNILGDPLCKLHEMFKRGKYEECKELQNRLIALNAAVTKKFGVSGLKLTMEWFGYYGGPTRKPMLPLNEQEVKVLRKICEESGFLQ